MIKKCLATNAPSEGNDVPTSPCNETTVTPITSSNTGETSFVAIADVNPRSCNQDYVEFCICTLLRNGYYDVMFHRSEQAKFSFTRDGSFPISGFETTQYKGICNVIISDSKVFGVRATICDRWK